MSEDPRREGISGGGRGGGAPRTAPPRPGRTLVVVVAAVLVLLLLRIVLWRPLAVVGEAPAGPYTQLAGAIHIHTTVSDGGGTPGEVVAAGQEAGLSFVVLTDHNTLDAKPLEGYHGRLLVVVGTEASTDSGHVLGLGIPDPVFRFSGDARDALEDIRDLGGAAFVAHPLSSRPDFRWTGWRLPGAWGLELMNGDSQWREAGRAKLLKTAALYALNPRYALLSSLAPVESTLERWDSLLQERAVPGILGLDAHSRLPVWKDRTLRFPSYAAMLGLAENHVLLAAAPSGDAQRDIRCLVEALARGRSYVGLDGLAPAGGFFFVARSGEARWTMGDTVPASSHALLEAGGALPPGTRLRLLRDGAVALEAEGPLQASAPGPGVYRVEARVPGWTAPFILSNPIYVFDEAEATERERRAAWPHPPAPPSNATLLDPVEGKTVFQPESDGLSRVALPILDPHGGPAGGGALRLGFRLAAPRPGHLDTFCALVNREKRDFSGRSGLVFSLRADGVYRLWVQVRDENPASTDDGTEWWSASVKTSPEWRRVVLPFARFRSIDRHTDGRLDLDKVRALVFVVDRGAVKVGTQGTIWLAAAGVY